MKLVTTIVLVVCSAAGWAGSMPLPKWIPIGKAGSGQATAYAGVLAAGPNGDLYVGGKFTDISGIPMNHIGKWNETEWSALGSGVNGPVRAIAVAGSDVYVGGEFSSAGGIPARAIAKWDGKTWSALGEGTDGFVNAIAVFKGDVYAGGRFTIQGNTPFDDLARWDGRSWSRPGSGVISAAEH